MTSDVTGMPGDTATDVPVVPGDATAEAFAVSRRRTVVDIAVQVVARGANLGLGVVVTLILVRALGTSGFGQWSSILAISQIATSFGDLGLTQIVVSRAARADEDSSQWLGALLGLRLVLCVPILIIEIAVVFAVVGSSSARIAGVLVSLTAILGAVSSLTAAFQLRVRNDLSMLVITVNSLVWTAGVAVAAATTHDIRVFALIFLVASALSSMLTVWLALRGSVIDMRGLRRLWRPALTAGLALGGAGILVTLYVRLDQILVLDLAGTREAGLYGAAYRVLDQIQFLPASVMTTLFPSIAAAFPGNLPRVRVLLQVVTEYLSMASLGVLAFTIVAARPVMTLLFGADFADAAPALPILMGAFVSISFGYLVGSMVAILSLQRSFFVYAVIALIVNAGLNVVLLPRYGFLAAAWVTLATELVVITLTTRRVLRALEMRITMRRLTRIVLVAAGMAALTWATRVAGAGIYAMIAVAAVSYVGLLLLSGALRVSAVRSLLRRDASGLAAAGEPD